MITIKLTPNDGLCFDSAQLKAILRASEQGLATKTGLAESLITVDNEAGLLSMLNYFKCTDFKIEII
jgi:hypothetical protein